MMPRERGAPGSRRSGCRGRRRAGRGRHWRRCSAWWSVRGVPTRPLHPAATTADRRPAPWPATSGGTRADQAQRHRPERNPFPAKPAGAGLTAIPRSRTRPTAALGTVNNSPPSGKSRHSHVYPFVGVSLTPSQTVIRVRRLRFPALPRWKSPAEVAEQVDALASGASGGNPVEVQVLSSAPEPAGRFSTESLSAGPANEAAGGHAAARSPDPPVATSFTSTGESATGHRY